MNNTTITITEGTRIFTITSDNAYQSLATSHAMVIRVASPHDFDISGARQSNQAHFVIDFTDADVDINGVAHHGNVTVTNRPGEYVEVCIK